MKHLSVIILVFLLCYGAYAQEWLTDFSAAKTLAAENDRLIILVFQGSDWCAPCIKLDREIWSTEEFRTYARDQFVMLKADFPRKRVNRLTSEQQEKNNKLAETYNRQGFFPFVVVLDVGGKVLGELGYEKTTPGEYIELLSVYKS